ncbi:Proline--tRNA ligase [Astathelohania contejeani]|uniref:proline--tRNA ligase n=1 Tax=Astathelohania contejeani TaxID=164912 RepID=A0ABQ7I226_9MICR|nr:Proline--tRNA ligase [Thelohania contejeani]
MTSPTDQKFGLTAKKNENFSEWYTQVITKGELIEYYDLKGCIIMRPASMHIWNCIRKFFNEAIEKMGVEETYFPMLVTRSAMEKEQNHVENFAPELAWITHCGDNALETPVAIRPTSEAIMYPTFSKWLRSHRDLPLQLNQWCNVLRWEVKSTTPFIRGREFLWQEGHTAFLTREEADKNVLEILNLYERVYKEVLAVPVLKGRKSENEKFGGAEYTTSLEAFISGTGRAVQAATSHGLGQNFAKMFGIEVDTPQGNQFVFQNSWGLTTRSIGIAVMVHSDDAGLVLPPWVAQVQVVIVPCGITATTSQKDKSVLEEYTNSILKELKMENIRAMIDDRENLTPGYKFNYWEIRGVPLRIEVGFRDLRAEESRFVRRYDAKKWQVKRKGIGKETKEILKEIHENMFNKAKKELEEGIVHPSTWDEFTTALNNKKIALIPWCNFCEEEIKNKTAVVNEDGTVAAMGAKSLCIPFDSKIDGVCINCGKEAKIKAYFGRSY